MNVDEYRALTERDLREPEPNPEVARHNWVDITGLDKVDNEYMCGDCGRTKKVKRHA